MVVAVVFAVVVGSLAALAIAAAGYRRPGTRHRAGAADRHVGGDDRLRDPHHVRRGSRRLAGLVVDRPARPGPRRHPLRRPDRAARAPRHRGTATGGGGDARRRTAAAWRAVVLPISDGRSPSAPGSPRRSRSASSGRPASCHGVARRRCRSPSSACSGAPGRCCRVQGYALSVILAVATISVVLLLDLTSSRSPPTVSPLAGPRRPAPQCGRSRECRPRRCRRARRLRRSRRARRRDADRRRRRDRRSARPVRKRQVDAAAGDRRLGHPGPWHGAHRRCSTPRTCRRTAAGRAWSSRTSSCSSTSTSRATSSSDCACAATPRSAPAACRRAARPRRSLRVRAAQRQAAQRRRGEAGGPGPLAGPVAACAAPRRAADRARP